MEIIKRRERIERVEYFLSYERKDIPGAGWSFPCDEQGNVKEDELQPAGLESLRECRANHTEGPFACHPPEVRESWTRYTKPAIGRCHCGREVELYGFTNTCDCGADYNSSGQLLAPRDQWGEETGESLADILNIR